MILADKIIELRKRCGWSQEELAEKIGVSRQSISKWEGAQSVPDMNRILKLSDIFDVSIDYLLRDEIDTIPPSQHDNSTDIEPAVHTFEKEKKNKEIVKTVSLDMANSYLDLKEKYSSPIAFGVFLCIISPTLLIVLSGFAEQHRILFSERMVILGIIVLILLVAVATSIFIYSDHKIKDFKFIESEPIETVYGVSGIVKDKKKAYESRHILQMIAGIFLCITSCIPVLLSILINSPTTLLSIFSAIGMLLFIIAVGVLLIVQTSIIWESFDALLEEGDYTRATKRQNKKISGIYWGSVITIYLLISFLSGWQLSWIIWPVAGVFYGVLIAILKNRYERNF